LHNLWIIGIIALYGAIMALLTYLSVRRKQDNADTFFTSNRAAPWAIVGLGMVGSSISGVTFISVPGDVGNSFNDADGNPVIKGMGYLQIVMGYLVGYLVIALLLIPIFYKLRLTSIYEYLKFRFGRRTQQTGAQFFVLSRALGAAARLYLATTVLNSLIFAHWGIPYPVTAAVVLLGILLYTRQGGLQTVLWTDVFQTGLMILGLVVCLTYIMLQMEPSTLQHYFMESPYGKILHWDWGLPNHFVKQFLSGIFLAIVMTGLDQDMMQKNLTCVNTRAAQSNIYLYSAILVVVNIAFVALGVCLYAFAQSTGYTIGTQSDLFFPTLAVNVFPAIVSSLVILALLAAAFNSVDGSLTALSTAICIDILALRPTAAEIPMVLIRRVHLWTTVGLLAIILLFYVVQRLALFDFNVISLVLSIAGYTYGPLLGLFALGFFSKYQIDESRVAAICVASPLLTFAIKWALEYYIGYKIGFELLLLNGLLTIIMMIAIGQKPKRNRYLKLINNLHN
jgi:Na+/proline symporter